jgi:hypothetical protein
MSPQETSTLPRATALARIGSTSGYRFTGNAGELNASITVVDDAAHNTRWALQLLARPASSESTNLHNGVIIAEASLPPLAEISGTDAFFATAPARFPAGPGEHQLSLLLVAQHENGSRDVHDLTTFPRNERFTGPRLSGEFRHDLRAHEITLAVDEIVNTRPADNLSGTLSLELWALPGAYTGGDFHGVPLAGAILGELAGQQSWNQPNLRLAFRSPPAGLWHLVLMLREWTGAGYTTCDFRNFEQGLLIEPTPRAVESAVINEPYATAKQAKAVAPATTVSVNRATVAELAAVKGLPKTVAAAIVAGRPYRSLDDLVQVKGIGPKMLLKLRSLLSL